MEMKIVQGMLPPKIIDESSEKEAYLIKEIVNKLEVSTLENNWVCAEFSTNNLPRFRAAFNRYLKKYNDGSGLDKKFTWENSNIWRIR